MSSWLVFIVIGLAAGIVGGLFGVGGGIIIVPMLIYWADFTQHKATGTSLAILLPPVGLAAVLEYYRHGNVDLRAGAIVAGTMFAGLWLERSLQQGQGTHLRLAFGVFVFVWAFI